MAVHFSHGWPLGIFGGPIRNTRFTWLVPYLDADGDPTDPTTPDTEISKDAGAFADCAEEVTTITGSNGTGYHTLSGAETDAVLVALAAKVASGPKNTLAAFTPLDLPTLESGTAQAGAAGTITLASGAAAYDLTGCVVRTTGGTGGGGTGGANNQARLIVAYNTSTKVATVNENWETNPSSDTTYDILVTALAPNAVMGRYLRPTTDGRTLDVSTGGEAGLDWANIGSPTTAQNLSGTNIDTDQVVASVAGAVGSVTGNVGGNVAGSVASVAAGGITSGSFAAGALTNTAAAADFLGASELASDAASEIAAAVRTELTTELGRVDAAVSTRATPAQVNAEVVDALATDTYAEPTGAPAATASLASKIGRLHQALRNKVHTDSNSLDFYDDAGVLLWSKALTDDGTDYNEAEGA